MYTRMIKRGDKGGVVVNAQARMNRVLSKLPPPMVGSLAPLIEDGDYGPKTGAMYQALCLVMYPGVIADPDHISMETIAGPFSEDAPRMANGMRIRGLHHIGLGHIPSAYGLGSTFGGPDDKYDRCEGQALLPGIGDHPPCDIPKIFPFLYSQGLFRQEAVDCKEWPMLTDERGRVRPAGLSWAMDTKNADFCALRCDTARFISEGCYNDRIPLILVYNAVTEKWVLCYHTDYGPAKSTGKSIDLSEHAQTTIGASERSPLYMRWGVY